MTQELDENFKSISEEVYIYIYTLRCIYIYTSFKVFFLVWLLPILEF